MPETVDLTPTWAAIIPLLILVLREGTSDGQQQAEDEIMRLALACDAMNARIRKETNNGST